MKLKLCYKKVKFPPEIMLKKVIEPAMEAPKEDKTLNLFLSKLGKGVPLLCIEQLMKGKTEGSLFYTMYRERVRLIGDTVTIYTEKNKSGEETKSFSKKEVIEALYRREEYAKKIYSESILCEYLDNLSPNGMPKYLEILKDKKIENTYIDSEVWDVDIIKDKISIWFQFDKERLPENEVIISRDTLIKAMEKWYEFLQKKVSEEYEEIIEV